MKKWEYKLVNSNFFKKPGLLKDFAITDVEAYLNKLGQQGWEIVYFDCKFKIKEIETFTAVAKREADETSQQPSAPEDNTEPQTS